MTQRFLQRSLCALFAVLLLLCGVKLPGESGAPEEHIAPEAIQDQTEPFLKPYWEEQKIYQEVTGELTYYCGCKKCCGPNAKGIAADGTVLAELGPDDIPVVGCNWLPLGTIIEVDGEPYRVADRGGKAMSTIGRLDVYTPEGHQAALQRGRVRGVAITIVIVEQEFSLDDE